MRTRGYTLIELLTVIAIIGLLSTLAVVALNSARKKTCEKDRYAYTNCDILLDDSTH